MSEHRLQVSPFVFTFPWRLIYLHRRVRQFVQLGNLKHRVWATVDDDITLIVCAQKLFEGHPEELNRVLELRLQDAFGHHWKRIGKRRRAAFEAYMLTGDRALIAKGYEYADEQMLHKRVASQKRRLNKIVAERVAIARAGR
jgi:hypothetical protein